MSNRPGEIMTGPERIALRDALTLHGYTNAQASAYINDLAAGATRMEASAALKADIASRKP